MKQSPKLSFRTKILDFTKHFAFAALLCLAPVCHAQSFVRGNIFGSGAEGLRIQGASASVGYTSGAGSVLDFGNYGQRDVYYTWASTTLSYSKGHAKTTFNVNYNPSYTSAFYAGNLNAFNQELGIQLVRKISARWTLLFAANGSDVTSQQFLFRIHDASVVGNSLNLSDLGGILTGGGDLLNPQATLFGSRVFSATGNTALSYRPNTRLTVSVRGQFIQSQARNHDDASAIVPRVRTEQGSSSVSYSLTPRSFLSGDASVSQTQSVVGDYRVLYFTSGFGKYFGLRWFVYASGGAGVFTPTALPQKLASGLSQATRGSSYVVNTSLGYRGRENTFAGVYNRSIGDTYGLSAGSTSSYQGTWTWRKRDRHWALFAFGQKQSIQGGFLGNLSLWQANVGLRRSLSRQTGVSLEYAYIRTLLPSTLPFSDPSLYSGRLTFFWRPAALEESLGAPVPGAPEEVTTGR